MIEALIITVYGLEKYDISSLDLDKIKYKIIMAHSPNVLRFIKDKDILCDLILAGHTHGNQIDIPVLKKLFNRKYHHFHQGLKSIEGKLVYISRGIGTTKIPIRINCVPQISLFKVYL